MIARLNLDSVSPFKKQVHPPPSGSKSFREMPPHSSRKNSTRKNSRSPSFNNNNNQLSQSTNGNLISKMNNQNSHSFTKYNNNNNNSVYSNNKSNNGNNNSILSSSNILRNSVKINAIVNQNQPNNRGNSISNLEKGKISSQTAATQNQSFSQNVSGHKQNHSIGYNIASHANISASSNQSFSQSKKKNSKMTNMTMVNNNSYSNLYKQLKYNYQYGNEENYAEIHGGKANTEQSPRFNNDLGAPLKKHAKGLSQQYTQFSSDSNGAVDSTIENYNNLSNVLKESNNINLKQNPPQQDSSSYFHNHNARVNQQTSQKKSQTTSNINNNNNGSSYRISQTEADDNASSAITDRTIANYNYIQEKLLQKIITSNSNNNNSKSMPREKSAKTLSYTQKMDTSTKKSMNHSASNNQIRKQHNQSISITSSSSNIYGGNTSNTNNIYNNSNNVSNSGNPSKSGSQGSANCSSNNNTNSNSDFSLNNYSNQKDMKFLVKIAQLEMANKQIKQQMQYKEREVTNLKQTYNQQLDMTKELQNQLSQIKLLQKDSYKENSYGNERYQLYMTEKMKNQEQIIMELQNEKKAMILAQDYSSFTQKQQYMPGITRTLQIAEQFKDLIV